MANVLVATAALGALGDGTRRAIFERLAQGPLAVGALAAGLPVTRPAVSQHLKVMRDAGLVIDEARGTRRVYRLDPRGIGALRDWLDEFWSGALAAFENHVENLDHEEMDHDDRAD